MPLCLAACAGCSADAARGAACLILAFCQRGMCVHVPCMQSAARGACRWPVMGGESAWCATILAPGRKRRTASAATLALLSPTWRLRKRNWRFRLLSRWCPCRSAPGGDLAEQAGRWAALGICYSSTVGPHQLDVLEAGQHQSLQQLAANPSRADAQDLGCLDLRGRQSRFCVTGNHWCLSSSRSHA